MNPGVGSITWSDFQEELRVEVPSLRFLEVYYI